MMVLQPDQRQLQKFHHRWEVAYRAYHQMQEQLFSVCIGSCASAATFTVAWVVDSARFAELWRGEDGDGALTLAQGAQFACMILVGALIMSGFAMAPVATCTWKLQRLRRAQQSLVFGHSGSKLFVEAVCNARLECYGWSLGQIVSILLPFFLSPLFLFVVFRT
jgi:hypothetical protein